MNSGILNSLHEQANCCNDGGNAQDVNLGIFTFLCCLLSLLASWSLPVDGEFWCHFVGTKWGISFSSPFYNGLEFDSFSQIPIKIIDHYLLEISLECFDLNGARLVVFKMGISLSR